MDKNVLTLKEILISGDFDNGIKNNLSLTDDILKLAMEKVLNSKANNSISIELTIDGSIADFENTLHVAVNEEGERIYLLESRLFNKRKDQMIGAYLEIFNSKLVKVESYIDDVFSYASWVAA